MKKKNDKKFNFWPYFAKYKGMISIWLSLVVIDIGIQTFTGVYVGYILAEITAGLLVESIKKFIVLTAVLLSANVVGHFKHILYFKVSNRIVNDMRVDIAEQAFKIADNAYNNHKTSHFTQRISSDPSTIFDRVHAFVTYLQQIITSVIMISYILIKSWLIGLIAVGAITIAFVIERFRRKVFKTNRRELLRRNDRTGGFLNEIVRSQKDIKCLNLESKLRENLTKLADSQAEQNIKTNTINRGYNTARYMFINAIICVMIVIGLWQVHTGLLTMAAFMIVYTNKYEVDRLTNVLSTFTDFSTEIDLAVSRISELYEDDEYELEKFGTQELENVQGHIEFKNVKFSYIEYREKPDEEVLLEMKQNKKKKIKTRVKTREQIGTNDIFENLNFEIEPNTTVAFVGISGSGKSTILNLISKMYEIDSGEVLIDGVNINSLTKQSLRNTISLVNQFPYIFDMTIKENLLLAKPEATDEEIVYSLKQAALFDFIESLPQKLDTVVGESGIKLSGGQKQRLAIARAMLKRSSVILFDESTSSLDNLAQNQVKESINNIKGKSTIIIVAHRLSTIKNVDKIFFLEKGQITDQGSFEELFSRNENFRKIFLAENI